MSFPGVLDNVIIGDWLEVPFWSVAELGQKLSALTPSGHKDQGIDDTQVKVYSSRYLKKAAQSLRDCPVRVSAACTQKQGDISPNGSLKIFLPSLFFLFSSPATSYFIVCMFVIYPLSYWRELGRFQSFAPVRKVQ